MDYFDIDAYERTLEQSLIKRKNGAQLYVAAYTKKISKRNKGIRKNYSYKNKDKEVIGHWDLMYFTDKAYVNLHKRL